MLPSAGGRCRIRRTAGESLISSAMTMQRTKTEVPDRKKPTRSAVEGDPDGAGVRSRGASKPTAMTR